MIRKNPKPKGKAPTPPSSPPKPRGRPPKKSGSVLSKLQLRDCLRQLETESPLATTADPELKVQCLSATDMLRLYREGKAVFISRGILRAILAELG